MSDIKVIVTGHQTYEERKVIYKTLDSLLKVMPGFELVGGDSKGCETHAAEWADLQDLKVTSFPVDWKNANVEGADMVEGPYGPYNRMAGINRTRAMLAYATHLIAFYNGNEETDKGTKIMIDMARKGGLKVKVFIVNGSDIHVEGGAEAPNQPTAASAPVVADTTPNSDGEGWDTGDDAF